MKNKKKGGNGEVFDDKIENIEDLVDRYSQFCYEQQTQPVLVTILDKSFVISLAKEAEEEFFMDDMNRIRKYYEHRINVAMKFDKERYNGYSDNSR